MTIKLDFYYLFRKVFDMPWSSCFGGAYTWDLGMGFRKIAYMVASATTVTNSEGDIGLFTHELLHNLGIGHTQKRPGKKKIKQTKSLIPFYVHFDFLYKTVTNTSLLIGRTFRGQVTVSMRRAMALSVRLTAPPMTAAASCTTLTRPSRFKAEGRL